MGRWLAIGLVLAAAASCGGGGSHATDAPAGPDGPAPCARGDDCNVAANTGCNDDDRCAVIMLGSCYFPACEPIGSTLVGDPCTESNNEGAESWDDCGVSQVCYQGVCTPTCALGGGSGGCTASMQCVPDADVGTFVLGVCTP